jgi:hypothetical protein
MTLDAITTAVIGKVASVATERIIRRLLPQQEQIREDLTEIRNEQERQSLIPLRTAVLHLERNEYDDARRHLLTSLGNTEDSALAHLLLSGAYLRLNRVDDAARDLWSGLLLNPYLLTDSEWSSLVPAIREGAVNALPVAPAPMLPDQTVRGTLRLPPFSPGHAPTWMYLLGRVRFQSGFRPVLESDPSGWMHEMKLKLTGWGGHAFVYAIAVTAWPDLSRAWVVFWWVGHTGGIPVIPRMESVVWAVDSVTGAFLWQHRIGPDDRLALVTPARVIIEETKPRHLFRLLNMATGSPISSMRPATFNAAFAPGWPGVQWQTGYERSHWQFPGSLFELWNLAKEKGEAGVKVDLSDPFGVDLYPVSLFSYVVARGTGSQQTPVLHTHTTVGRFPQEEIPDINQDAL